MTPGSNPAPSFGEVRADQRQTTTGRPASPVGVPVEPLNHFASPTANVPADFDTPTHRVSRDTFPQASCRALNSPVRIAQIDDGDGRLMLVEPLHFHRVLRREGRAVVAKSHATLNTNERRDDHE